MAKPIWWITKDGDETCKALYDRHYSAEASLALWISPDAVQ